jgi:HEAT repeat protein
MNFPRLSAIIAATLAVVLAPVFLRAQDTPQTPSAKDLIAVLRSDAATFDKARACQQLTALGDKEAVPALAALLGDDKLASHARSALEGIADPSAAAALRDSLGRLHGNLLIGAINSLGVRRDVKSADAIEKLTHDQAPGVVEAAWAALGRMGHAKGLGLKGASPETRTAVGHAALACAERLQAQGKKAEAIELLDLVRNADVPKQIRDSATYGAMVARGSADLSLLTSQLKTDDAGAFAMAIRASRRIPGPEVTKALMAAMGPLAPARQAVVIAALADRGDASVLPVVQKAATAGPVEVRLAAVLALGKLGDATSVATLVDAALAADAGLAQAAQEGLLLMRAEGVDAAIVGRLAQADAKDRITLLDILGQRGAASAASAIAKAADDPAGEVRFAAIRALGRVVGPEDLPALVARLPRAATPEEAAVVQEALRAACNRVPDPDACTRKLQDCMAAAPLPAQCFLLELIGQIGGGEALKIVSAHARDGREEIRDAATRALGNWMSPDAAPVLLDLAKTLDDARLRSRAFRGYLRIARQLDLPMDRRLAMCEEVMTVAQRDEEKRLAAEVVRTVVRKGASEADAARAKAILAKMPRKNGPLFDGRTFDGWEGDTQHSFRIEDGAIVGGTLKARIPRNEFLCTRVSYGNFVLKAECRILGPGNGGIQIRSQRVPNNHEVSGYQADMSADANGGYWGCLYDESRRNRVLIRPDNKVLMGILKPNDWNQYEIRCEGPRIRLFLNGVQTVDYVEKDSRIPLVGIIGLQIHGGGPSEVWYRNITLEELP